MRMVNFGGGEVEVEVEGGGRREDWQQQGYRGVQGRWICRLGWDC